MAATSRSAQRRAWSWQDETDSDPPSDTYEDKALRAIASWESWVRAGSHLESVPRRDPLPRPRPGARARVCRGLAQRAQSLCVNPELARFAAEAAQAPGAEGAECAGVLAEQWWCLWQGGGLGPALLQLLLRTEARPAVLSLWEHVDLELGLTDACVALLLASLEIGRPEELVPLLQRVWCLAARPGAAFWRSLQSAPDGGCAYGLLAQLCWDVLGVQLPSTSPACWAVVLCDDVWVLTAPQAWEEPTETEATLTPASLAHATSSWDNSSRWGDEGCIATPTGSDVACDRYGVYDLGTAEELQTVAGSAARPAFAEDIGVQHDGGVIDVAVVASRERADTW